MSTRLNVHTEQQGPVLTITLDRPERRNAVDGPTALALRAAFEAFEADDRPRVAARSATFGVFCRRWGVPLIDGGTVRLPRIVGMGRALDMILSGRPVGADEALLMGLATQVVDDGQALAAAQALAARIAAFPQLCMNADRASAPSARAPRQWVRSGCGAPGRPRPAGRRRRRSARRRQ